MAYSQQFPIGRRVRVSSSFSFDGHLIDKGETGEVVANGANTVTVQLDKPHKGLDENAVLIEPPEWGLEGRDFGSKFKHDRMYHAREAIHRNAPAWLFAAAVSGASFGVVAHATIDEDKLPAHVVRFVETAEGGQYRVTFERVGPETGKIEGVVWKVIDYHEITTQAQGTTQARRN